MMITVDGAQAYAATGGKPFDADRPVVAFIHGAGMDATYWSLQCRWFAWHGWSVLALDLPGHGRSEGQPLMRLADMAGWLGQALTAAGAERAALVGHSMGGAIAIEAAAAMPARITHLALLGTASAIPVAPALLKAARDNPDAAYDMMVGWGHGPAARIGCNQVPGLWMTGAASALLARNRPGVLAADLQACNDWQSGPDSARRINCPTTVIVGDQDVMTPRTKGQALAQMVPGARLVTVQRSGHMMLQEAPDAVLDALIVALEGGAA
jgi:pimeloyl-ACP methyl ester carboxylesterase